MRPSKELSAPIGICNTIGLAMSLLRMLSTVISKSAPTLSILFTKQIQGKLYFRPCLQTVSLWACTPSLASNTATALSRTRNDLSTSAVKSMCPGVSIRLISKLFHGNFVAADVMVIPLFCSSSIKSITAVPSWTSPIL